MIFVSRPQNYQQVMENLKQNEIPSHLFSKLVM